MAKKIDYASLYTLRKDGRYQGYYTDEKGRHCVNDRDPEALYHKIQEKLNPAPKPILFQDIAQLWHDERWETMPEGTKANYTAPYNRAVDRFGDWAAVDVSAYEISLMLEAMKLKDLSASTIKTQLVIIKSIFQRAIVDEYYGKTVKINPAISVKIPKGLKRPKKREAPEDEIVKMIQDKCTTAYFGDFAMFLMCTGMRRGEALAIRWADIDFEEGFISVHSSLSLRGSRGQLTAPKTESGVRKVPILPPVLQVLKKPEGAKETDFVFHSEDPSRPMPKSAYDRRWKRYCKEMGFVIDEPEERASKQKKKYIVHHYKNTLTAHYLRHGYATLLYEAGIDEKEAAALMGHADEEMLRKVYAHLRKKKEAKASDKLKEFTKDGLITA